MRCDVVGIGGFNRSLFAEMPYVRDVYSIDSRSAPYWFNRSQRALVTSLRQQQVVSPARARRHYPRPQHQPTGPGVAAALNCPLVVLFGKANPRRFRPVSLASPVRVIQGFADQGGDTDIGYITVQQVFDEWLTCQGSAAQ